MDKSTRKQVIECLKELSDSEYQERVWLRGEGFEVSTPSELVAQLFDDTALADELEEFGTGPVFSKKIDATLFELLQLLSEVDLYSGVTLLFSDPKWKTIRSLAKQVVDLMEQTKSTRPPDS